MKKKSILDLIKLEYTHFIVYIYAFYGGGVDNIPDRNFYRLVNIDTPCIITYFNVKVCIYPGKCLLVKDNVK